MAIRELAGAALQVVAMAGPAVEGAAGPVPRTRRAGSHRKYAGVQAAPVSRSTGGYAVGAHRLAFDRVGANGGLVPAGAGFGIGAGERSRP
ncbi:hypothetical protein AB0F15_26095 [Amycolatopsis sp. NPDC026612]|uniref:hypothetical protein n=1 Tax=Amycolatopsis sp. NPDC026612 TaxID=3155466 RepID=UPI0033E20022